VVESIKVEAMFNWQEDSTAIEAAVVMVELE